MRLKSLWKPTDEQFESATFKITNPLFHSMCAIWILIEMYSSDWWYWILTEKFENVGNYFQISHIRQIVLCKHPSSNNTLIRVYRLLQSILAWYLVDGMMKIHENWIGSLSQWFQRTSQLLLSEHWTSQIYWFHFMYIVKNELNAHSGFGIF